MQQKQSLNCVVNRFSIFYKVFFLLKEANQNVQLTSTWNKDKCDSKTNTKNLEIIRVMTDSIFFIYKSN